MATLATTKLTITSDAEKKTSRCVVTCKVGFTAFELNDMKNGLNSNSTAPCGATIPD